VDIDATIQRIRAGGFDLDAETIERLRNMQKQKQNSAPNTVQNTEPNTATTSSTDSPAAKNLRPVAVLSSATENSLQGIVLDAEGNPLSGVKVTCGKTVFTTKSDGQYSFTKADATGGRVSVRFEKSGYFTVTRSQRRVESEGMYIEAVLNPSGNSDNSVRSTFESSKGTTVSLASGMKIAFPAASIMRADGSAFNGRVTVDALYLDPGHELFSSMRHGDIAAMTKDGKNATINSNGVVNVVLADDAGKALQLKTGSSATLTFPIPANSGDLKATLPMCCYNEAKGVWVEETVATRQGNVYVAKVNHFTGWDWAKDELDTKADIIQIVKVEDCEGKPFPNAVVTIEQYEAKGLGIGPAAGLGKKTLYKGFGITNGEGIARVICLTWTPAKITADGKGMTDSTTTTPEFDDDPLAPVGGPPIAKKIVTLTLCQDVKSGTIIFPLGDNELYLYFDHWGQKRRWDLRFVEDINHVANVVIYDEINGLYCRGTRWIHDAEKMEDWQTMGKIEASNHTVLQLFEKYSEEQFEALTQIVLKGGTRTTETVAGQQCEVYRFQGMEWAVWGGTVMLRTPAFQSKATSATRGCPDGAFTQTFDF
jgi:protocatechuate 3,4-dioxygenase beta subunit